MSENLKCCVRKMPVFVGYITAGYPDRKRSIDIIRRSCEAGLDILEAGFPAKDPSCDGAVIREAQSHVDRRIALDLDYWRALRKSTRVPIWLMGYKDDLLEDDIYLKLAQERLYNALVVPDFTREEFDAAHEKLRRYGVETVGFINPNQTEEEVASVAQKCNLIYHQLYCGVTGQAHNDSSYLTLMKLARSHGKGKLFAGFGISTPQRAAELARSGYDGVIIGSAIMKQLLESEEKAYAFIAGIKEALLQEG